MNPYFYDDPLRLFYDIIDGNILEENEPARTQSNCALKVKKKLSVVSQSERSNCALFVIRFETEVLGLA
jgi:hypothetical protein